MKIISISGKKHSGKTTVAQLTRDILLGYDSDLEVHIIAWADALKQEVSRACGISVDYLNEHKENFRLILQGWGTDFRRNLCSKDYWIVKFLSRITKLPDDSIVIVPDTRFFNELDLLRDVDATTWLVLRDKQIVDNRLISNTLKPDTHESENNLEEITDYDSIIENYYSIGELKQSVVVALEKSGLIKYVNSKSTIAKV